MQILSDRQCHFLVTYLGHEKWGGGGAQVGLCTPTNTLLKVWGHVSPAVPLLLCPWFQYTSYLTKINFVHALCHVLVDMYIVA